MVIKDSSVWLTLFCCAFYGSLNGRIIILSSHLSGLPLTVCGLKWQVSWTLIDLFCLRCTMHNNFGRSCGATESYLPTIRINWKKKNCRWCFFNDFFYELETKCDKRRIIFNRNYEFEFCSLAFSGRSRFPRTFSFYINCTLWDRKNSFFVLTVHFGTLKLFDSFIFNLSLQCVTWFMMAEKWVQFEPTLVPIY